jgi:hypothetical protein
VHSAEQLLLNKMMLQCGTLQPPRGLESGRARGAKRDESSTAAAAFGSDAGLPFTLAEFLSVTPVQ